MTEARGLSGPLRESAAFLFSPRQSQLNSKLHFNLFLRLSWAIGYSLLQLRKLFLLYSPRPECRVASRPQFIIFMVLVCINGLSKRFGEMNRDTVRDINTVNELALFTLTECRH